MKRIFFKKIIAMEILQPALSLTHNSYKSDTAQMFRKEQGSVKPKSHMVILESLGENQAEWGSS